jgi:hypothetical protein
MATWPSASKASTANLDSGSDSPRLARADIKQNVDNVNSIIDMFNIDSPTADQILKYNTGNGRFELGTETSSGNITFVGDDSTGTAVSLNETFKIAGTQNITTAVSGDTLTITGPDLSSYLTSVAESDVTQHQAALSITESQISDLQSYLTSETFTSLAQDTTPQLGGNLDVNGNNIVSVSNGNIVIQPNGTGDIDLDGEVRFNKNYKEDINALTSSTAITVDASLASVHSVTLAHNTTFTISNLPTGGSVTIIITQDGTGSRTGAFTSVKFAGGTPTLTTDASAIDVVTIFNDGTNVLGTCAKAFAA